MPVDTIKQRFADICDGITGINSTHVRVPRNVASADYPAVVVLTGEATNVDLGNDLGMETRQYRLALLVMPFTQGVEGEAEELTEPFWARFRSAFTSRPGLWLTTQNNPLRYVQDTTLSGDTGVTGITLAGVEYSGAIFTVQVEELYEITQGY